MQTNVTFCDNNFENSRPLASWYCGIRIYDCEKNLLRNENIKLRLTIKSYFFIDECSKADTAILSCLNFDTRMERTQLISFESLPNSFSICVRICVLDNSVSKNTSTSFR